MYKKGKVSLEKAAELAGMGTIEFKEVLINKGIERYLRADINDMKKSDQVIHKMK
jgi:predicted HTH domain antitoxin